MLRIIDILKRDEYDEHIDLWIIRYKKAINTLKDKTLDTECDINLYDFGMKLLMSIYEKHGDIYLYNKYINNANRIINNSI